jgi:RAB protein geranylgeranyltransferase component A
VYIDEEKTERKESVWACRSVSIFGGGKTLNSHAPSVNTTITNGTTKVSNFQEKFQRKKTIQEHKYFFF